MKRTVLPLAIAWGLASAIATAYQGGADRQAIDHASVHLTVIGCVRPANEPSAPAIAAPPIPDTHFVLRDITLAGDRASAGSPAGAAAGSPAEVLAEGVKSYRLDDAGNQEIAPHVGQRVEVAGTIVAAPASPIGTAGRDSSSSGGQAGMPRLRVETIKTIADDSGVCSR